MLLLPNLGTNSDPRLFWYDSEIHSVKTKWFAYWNIGTALVLITSVQSDIFRKPNRQIGYLSTPSN